MAQWKQTQLLFMRMQVRSLALLSRLKIWRSCELWGRLAATAPIQPLAWELPYAAGVALKRKKKRRNLHFKDEPSKLTPKFLMSGAVFLAAPDSALSYLITS